MHSFCVLVCAHTRVRSCACVPARVNRARWGKPDAQTDMASGMRASVRHCKRAITLLLFMQLLLGFGLIFYRLFFKLDLELAFIIFSDICGQLHEIVEDVCDLLSDEGQ